MDSRELHFEPASRRALQQAGGGRFLQELRAFAFGCSPCAFHVRVVVGAGGAGGGGAAAGRSRCTFLRSKLCLPTWEGKKKITQGSAF